MPRAYRLTFLSSAIFAMVLTMAAACGGEDADSIPDPRAASDGGSSQSSGGASSSGSSGTGGSSGLVGGGSSGGGSSGALPDGGPDTSGPYPPRAHANVLFSGHSLLDPIPAPLVALIAARGDTIGWERHSIPGSPIRVRTYGMNDTPWSGYRSGDNKNGSGRNILAELATPTQLGSGQHYDTLTITERHDPLLTLQWENTVGYLRHYHDRVAEHEANARTLFYQVWPDIDKANPQPWITYQATELPLWECIAGKVNLSLESAGKPQNVIVIPGSLALARLVTAALADQIPGITGSTRQKLDLLFSDNVHLTATSAYFIAALHYGATYGKTPVGANAGSGVGADTALALEQLAWTALGEYASSGHPRGRTDMAACRTEVASNVCPAFFSIRNLGASDCSYWTSADSPLRFPDPSLPLPAP